jgi:hypothetical protein
MNIGRSSTVLKMERATTSRPAAQLSRTSSCNELSRLLTKWRLAQVKMVASSGTFRDTEEKKKRDSCIWAAYQQTLNVGRNVAGNSALKDRKRAFQKITIWRLKADALSSWEDTKQRSLSSRGSLLKIPKGIPPLQKCDTHQSIFVNHRFGSVSSMSTGTICVCFVLQDATREMFYCYMHHQRSHPRVNRVCHQSVLVISTLQR